MRGLLRFWFTFEQRVDSRTYATHGFLLMLAKYLTDAAVVWLVAHVIWTPTDYALTSVSLAHSKLSAVPTAVRVVLAVWTLPFIWVGLTMTMRRLLDAGMSAWYALLFFVPYVNYLLMLLLCMVPTSREVPHVEEPRPYEAKLPGALLAVGVGTALGLGMVALSALALSSYGASLFFGTPFVLGAITAYLFNRRYPASQRETTEVVMLTLAATAGSLILFAVEGAICLLMVAPVALCLGWMGGRFGRWIARADRTSPAHALVAMILPLVAPLAGKATPIRHEVRSVVEIDAAPAVVWRNVATFPRLQAPTDMLFRSGIAYPIGARIEGSGVGAIRYCDFSTGSFVEPITTWDTNRRLSFDIVANPAPMRELSPYRIEPPHLDGYFSARRGEFRLRALPNGRTRLEGSTWYDLNVGPDAYWSVIASAIVSRIHMRVLTHIKQLAERN